LEGQIRILRGANRLLDALSAAQKQELRRSLRPVFLGARRVLFEPGEIIDAIYFPLDCVVSLVSPLQEGITVEVATIGNEGIVGVPIVAAGSLLVRAVSSVAGWADRMDATNFLAAVNSDRGLQELVNDYVRALFGQIAQAAACNRLHSNEARLSRWLLMTHDRVGSDEFAITHEMVGEMLGSRRGTVSLSAKSLRVAGLITHQRGRVTIVDRTGLQAVACECYAATKTALDAVVERARLRSLVSGDSTNCLVGC
jgi:CRP-like cAMP-binding protein